MYPRWIWPSFALPGVAWLILLFLVPMYAVIGVAFGNVDTLLQIPIPVWNPLSWNIYWMNQALHDLAPGGVYWPAVVRTLWYVATSLALCLLIGYPVAYYIARHAGRTKAILLILLIIPFWISYLMRMLAWVNLLSPGGYADRFLSATGISRLAVDTGVITQTNWLSGQSATVILALVYGYIPYLILPLYAALDRIDKTHLEAARDLGASPFRAFLHVTLPLSKTGILGGSVLIALPMFGDYYTPDVVSSAPSTTMIGNQIDTYFHGGLQATVGAAITVILSIFLTILMGYYLWAVRKATRDVETL
jgi:ABC-type spermidine/putrescine transport system permease subunit I